MNAAETCALKHAGLLMPLVCVMLMATPATWDPSMMPMSAAEAFVRQAGKGTRTMSPYNFLNCPWNWCNFCLVHM